MRGLSCPDVNVWLAVLPVEHTQHPSAKSWWNPNDFEAICFTRLTQSSVLGLLTTSSVMNGKPLTRRTAWNAYDRMFGDDRVCFLSEPAHMERHLRRHSSGNLAAPKVWADAWLITMAESCGGTIVTFDARLASRSREVGCVVLK